MSYTPHTPEEIQNMLERIGVPDVDALFDSVPATLRSRAKLKLAQALDERSLLARMRDLAAENLSVTRLSSFLGAGAYHHFIPVAVDALAGRAEFTTAYTPYQAEISQGTLQAIFEFQTMICQLTALDVANASLYDGASATAEAALMALRTTRRRRVILSHGLHPHYQHVLRTYLRGLDVEVDLVPLAPDGCTPAPAVAVDSAALIVQYPNFLGCIEDLDSLAAVAHDAGALFITTTAEPLALGILTPPGEHAVDIACGEAQSFGVPLSFGGPYVGFLATRQRLLRQLPGRLIGETVDAANQRGFVMTLTTREQHIRREKATSNICTNQGLCALRVSIYLALLGRCGLRRLAEINLSLAHYARDAFTRAGLRLPYAAPCFNEFVVEVPRLAARMDAFVENGILPGLALERIDPARRDQLLVCTTEMNERQEIDWLARELAA